MKMIRTNSPNIYNQIYTDNVLETNFNINKENIELRNNELEHNNVHIIKGEINEVINQNKDRNESENVDKLESENFNLNSSTIDSMSRNELKRRNGFEIYLPKRRVKREDDPDPRCEYFMFNNKDQKYISHPFGDDSKNNYYYSKLDCVTVISGK